MNADKVNSSRDSGISLQRNQCIDFNNLFYRIYKLYANNALQYLVFEFLATIDFYAEILIPPGRDDHISERFQ